MKRVLITIAAAHHAGGLDLGLATAPDIGLTIKKFVRWYQEKNPKGRHSIRQALIRLRRQGMIEFQSSPDTARVLLTEAGKRKLLELELPSVKIPPLKQWDNVWRMIMSDIPESRKKSRDAFRRELVRLGFHRIQRSVWVHPYPCKKQVESLTTALDIASYVRAAELSRFDGEEELMRKFGLSSYISGAR